MTYSHRTDHLKAEGAYFVLAQAQALEAQGVDIVHLEIGQPDIDTFDSVASAGIQAIQAGHTRYNPPAGLPQLREAIAEDVAQRVGMSITSDQVVVSPGAKPNLFFPTLAIVEPGDEVIYPDPGFPSYAAMIGVAGGVSVPVPLVERTGFSFDLAAFDDLVSERTRMIILNSPGNPTGGVMPFSDLEHIAIAAQKYDCWVISDEIYSRIHYLEGELPSIVSLPGMAERTILVDGFSKTYAMTGWRLGYGVMPVELAQRVTLLATHAYGCAAEFTQYAGLEALHGSQAEVEAMLERYRQRRDRLVAGLNELPGVHCELPQGAFYAFPNIQSFGLSSRDLAERILHEAGVALLPGTAFGAAGEGYLRLSYATNLEQIEHALERLAPFFAGLS
ncbi:MAG: pyridoxal phosphate-dependent aminotransferase [Anaerolineales bacterium]|nr:MAG: pyridoxal phosphate-dependent aminotransferase [Anaerolineales bacterium]